MQARYNSGRVLQTDTISHDKAGCSRVRLTEVVRWWYPGSEPHQGGGTFVASGSEVFIGSDTSSPLSQLRSISLNHHTVRRANRSFMTGYTDVKVVPQVEFKFVVRNMSLPPVIQALMTPGVTSGQIPDTVIVDGLRRTDAHAFDGMHVPISNMKIEKVVVPGDPDLEWTPNNQ